ncbi:hypothetical protein [Salinarimonas ramus]|nr:hypothetical protein [Salinarimonas ramus]
MAKLEVDDDLVRRLETRAKLAGKPLAELVRETLAAAVPLTGEEKAERIREFHRRCGPFTGLTAPEDLIRESRDER